MARQLIASLSADFDAEQFEDTYRNQVLDLIERKAAGHTEVVAPPVAMEEDKVVDLMAALEASVKSAKAARQRHPAGAAAEDGAGRRPRRSAPARARSAAPCRRSAPSSVVEVDGRRLKVSNLDKVLYPDAGFTKAEVIDYYVRVAPAMLPHIADRGVTLRRYPNGVDGQSFFEKRCPSHRPEWIGTFAGPGRPQRHDRVLRPRLRRRRWRGRPTWPRSRSTPRWRAATTSRRRRCACSTSTRARRPTSTAAPRWRSTSAPCSTTSPASSASPRPRGRRGSSSTCRSTGPHTHEHCSSFAQAVAQVLEKHHGDRVTSVDGQGGPARARCSSTGARTAGTRPRWPCTRCGPGPAPRCPPR